MELAGLSLLHLFLHTVVKYTQDTKQFTDFKKINIKRSLFRLPQELRRSYCFLLEGGEGGVEVQTGEKEISPIKSLSD